MSDYKSYTQTKSPEERKQYVQQQIALGNPKYKNRNDWIKENIDKIRLNNLVTVVAQILAKLNK